MLGKLAQQKGFASLQRRQFDNSLKGYIKSYPQLELLQRIVTNLNLSWLLPHEGASYSMYDTAQYIDQKIAKRITKINTKQVRAVYAYEDMAQRAFEHAKAKQMTCFYDLPIAYWRAYRHLLEEEKNKQADWGMTLTGFQNSEQKIAQKDKELELADHIFVASQFTANSLTYFPKPLSAQVHIVPYGFPQVSEAAKARVYDFHKTKRPLRLLFVGGLSQRKGLSYLFEAVEHFGDKVELTVVGRKISEDCQPLNTALKRHTWIPTLPHEQVLALMQENDVFLFPSLFEGFGLVITEAMSQGTPVIATERTAAPDIITDGKDGYLVKAASSADLIEKMEAILRHPERLEELGKEAMKTAAARPWTMYGKELSEVIKQILAK